ncbi:MAG: nucleoside hydrolase [Spirochaetales bacterium]|nr:nucleoside hydrolase [Candidatus Physcosoma equi]
MAKERIILDVDTGHDDAVAIALAAGLKDRIQIDALIATNGNQVLGKTLENTLNLAEALEIEAPVFHGSSLPLIRERYNAGNIHGESGFDGPVFEKRRRKEDQGNGILWAVDHVLANPGEVTFVSVGPWTDLAVCIKADDRFAKSLKGIVLMGGAVNIPGNCTPSAEFNVYADPEAADIVMQCGAPITIMSLDVTHQVRLNESIMEAMRNKKSRYKDIFLASMGFYTASLRKVGTEWPAMHDPCCIAYLADPSIFRFEKRDVRVETNRGLSYGKTIGGWLDESSNTQVGCWADEEKFWKLFLDAVEQLP